MRTVGFEEIPKAHPDMEIMGTRNNGDVYDFMLFIGDWM
jgi:hypothetical protein